MDIKIVYKYDSNTKEYLAEQTLNYTDKSPSGRFNIPGNCTEVQPPQHEENTAYIYNGAGWNTVPDYRGHKYWLNTAKYGDAGIEVKDIGDLPGRAALTARFRH